ncbi:MAG: hypothetical protein PHF57_09400 [Methanoregula sp.]|nr:hypothetical protein [Methanoregula sp.]MDD5188410.1 hypothetical protein [Methanoregula sp.]
MNRSLLRRTPLRSVHGILYLVDIKIARAKSRSVVVWIILFVR